MHTSLPTFLITVGLFVACGCRPSDESPGNGQSPSPPAAPAFATDLDALVARQGTVTFRSFGGKWVGLDGDSDLTFMPNGAAHLFQYGVGVTGYAGTYTIDPDGRVSVQLPKLEGAWPAMLLQKDATSLLLVPVQNPTSRAIGNRGGATVINGQGAYWPFRPVSLTEENQVRVRIGNGS